MAKLVDASDLKLLGWKQLCGFDPRSRHSAVQMMPSNRFDGRFGGKSKACSRKNRIVMRRTGINSIPTLPSIRAFVLEREDQKAAIRGRTHGALRAQSHSLMFHGIPHARVAKSVDAADLKSAEP
jgi:hypothetical protein